MGEADQVRERYQRRSVLLQAGAYDPLLPSVFTRRQEKERALIRWVRAAGLTPVADKRVIEVGCGTGDNLLQLMQLGFDPANLEGNELLEERVAAARRRLPAEVAIHPGDALELPVALGSFDVVYQSMVFSSLLDEGFRQALSARLWALAKPGGGVLWYDFTYNNPRNPDVRGIPLREVRALFPEAEMASWRLTLAPPLAKRVTALHPGLYGWVNALPFLRTHVLCWLRKRG